ncbi:MAG: hypothetical protein AAGF85_00385 [Bacteroidota bacterium]
MRKLVWLLLCLIPLILISWISFKSNSVPKIAGINLVAPPNPVGREAFHSLRSTNANWLSVIPYGFLRPNESIVRYNYQRQWWGEGLLGASKTIQMAHDLGYKVMLKPHVWVINQGWAGDFEPRSEEHWQKWEKSYEDYIMAFAKVSDSLNVELFCIGTEFRKTVIKRPEYWRSLIKKVRTHYKGKITYAANWDNFENITFWSDLDFIGIDAYFPLCQDKTPSPSSIGLGWDSVSQQIERVSKRYNKPILFTEYGYKSIDYAADGHWKYDHDTLRVNYIAQANAYEALYETVWDKAWFRGGFLWKWHLQSSQRKGLAKEFTPQDKPVLRVIQKYYK